MARTWACRRALDTDELRELFSGVRRFEESRAKLQIAANPDRLMQMIVHEGVWSGGLSGTAPR